MRKTAKTVPLRNITGNVRTSTKPVRTISNEDITIDPKKYIVSPPEIENDEQEG